MKNTTPEQAKVIELLSAGYTVVAGVNPRTSALEADAVRKDERGNVVERIALEMTAISALLQSGQIEQHKRSAAAYTYTLTEAHEAPQQQQGANLQAEGGFPAVAPAPAKSYRPSRREREVMAEIANDAEVEWAEQTAREMRAEREEEEAQNERDLALFDMMCADVLSEPDTAEAIHQEQARKRALRALWAAVRDAGLSTVREVRIEGAAAYLQAPVTSWSHLDVELLQRLRHAVCAGWIASDWSPAPEPEDTHGMTWEEMQAIID